MSIFGAQHFSATQASSLTLTSVLCTRIDMYVVHVYKLSNIHCTFSVSKFMSNHCFIFAVFPSQQTPGHGQQAMSSGNVLAPYQTLPRPLYVCLRLLSKK